MEEQKSVHAADPPPAICVLATWPIVTVTIEADQHGGDDIYFNAGGQGAWIARMSRALGAQVTFCGPFGGHSGRLAETLLEAEGLRLRAVPVSAPCGSYVDDRRSGARDRIATQGSPRLDRHEADDLCNAALAEGLAAGCLVISGQFGEENLSPERIAALARDLGRNGVKVIADVAGPTLEALDGGVSILKVSHEELIELGLAKDASRGAMVVAMRRLADTRAEDVVVSLAEAGALGVIGGELYAIEHPAFEPVDTTGAGDSMTAALAVSRARGLAAEPMLQMAAAAGALNVTRHGRGTGSRPDVDEIARRVDVRHLKDGET